MKINLSHAKRMQSLKGWGTSACWWAQACSDKETQKELAGLLYGKSGLALNIYRYNIGGGFDPDNCRVENPWRRCDSFMLYDKESEERSWDFSRDKTAVEVMKQCLETGNVDTLILFCNSPHYSLTSTGQASGGLIYHTCNIPKMNYKKFVDYALDVTQHFIDEGYPVKYLSPINEPQWKWGGPFVWQEGCHYEAEELFEIYKLFADEIIKRKMPIKLYGPESGELLGDTKKYFDLLYSDENIKSVLPIFAVHSYHADDSPEIRKRFKKEFVEKYPEIRFDQSEWCELPNKSHTKNFKGALITARVIGQDLIYAGCESWTSWVAVNQYAYKEDGFDYSDAMFSANDEFTKWSMNERYYALAHFSKYIPVGSFALDIGFDVTDENNAFNLFGFETPSGDTVLVAVNESGDKEVSLGGDFGEMTVVLSNKDKKLAEEYNGKFTGEIHIPSSSLVTVILR